MDGLGGSSGPLVRGFAAVAKHAAQGAALIADGLAGGVHGELIEAMRLREAGGTVLDHLFLAGSGRIAEVMQEWERRSEPS